jgi:hypothetical protein
VYHIYGPIVKGIRPASPLGRAIIFLLWQPCTHTAIGYDLSFVHYRKIVYFRRTAIFVGLPTKLGRQNKTEENRYFFVGCRRKYVNIFVGSEQYFRRPPGRRKYLASCKKQHLCCYESHSSMTCGVCVQPLYPQNCHHDMQG